LDDVFLDVLFLLLDTAQDKVEQHTTQVLMCFQIMIFEHDYIFQLFICIFSSTSLSHSWDDFVYLCFVITGDMHDLPYSAQLVVLHLGCIFI
jgi:hypothetical protein